MTDFLTELIEQRRKLLDALDANEGDINLDIFEDFYPDQAHFVFELLQNAEDAQATEVSFSLSSDGCLFEHNGKRLFTERDVKSITGIHTSTKDKDDDKIGKFGVGFKSVFVYTDTPEIRSGEFAFRIVKYVMPEKIDADAASLTMTRFWFPFNNTNKPKDIAFREVNDGLRGLADTTILFLSNIHAINWKIDDGTKGSILRVEHSDQHVEVLKEESDSATTSHLLRFSKAVEGLERQKVSIAFSLEPIKAVEAYQSDKPLADQFVISKIPGQVAVFFPAEKETSGLRFHLHAPFVTGMDRASIKDTSLNDPLFEQIEKLASEALFDLRDMGFLTVQTLSVFPNTQDEIPPRYQGIRRAIISAMNEKDLTPSKDAGHKPATSLVQSKASLKNILDDKGLNFWIDPHSPGDYHWAISAPQKNSMADKFLSDLNFMHFSFESFVERIKHFANYDDEDYDTLEVWLNSKDNAWFQSFYALLYSELNQDDEFGELENSRIIKLKSGGYSKPKNCFFPTNGSSSKEFDWVDEAVFQSGNKTNVQQKRSKKFLESVGVRSVGELEEIEQILRSRYSKDGDFPDLRTNISDLKRFSSYLKSNPKAVKIFEGFYIFQTDEESWGHTKIMYLDAPYKDTGLRLFFEAFDKRSKWPISKKYKGKIEKSVLIDFCEKLGVCQNIPIEKTSCRSNPDRSLFFGGYGSRTSYERDTDFKISGLESRINQSSLEFSRLIWQSLSTTGLDWWQASYCRNYNDGYRYGPSQLAALLTKSEWVPQEDGDFVQPKFASADKLPQGFPFDKGWKWLEVIKFGREVELEKEKARTEAAEAQARKSKKQAAAAELGFDNPDDLDLLVELSELTDEERHEMREAMRKRKRVSELPENEPSNPERRDARVREIAKDAQERETEKRARSVSVGQGVIKQEAKQYLQHQYTGDDGLICQICEKPMPFALDDGAPYFEAVEFLADNELRKRHHQNYLALCPNHAAMFRHANGSKDIIKEMLLELTEERLEVVLAQADRTIYFTKTHIADLQSALSAERDE